MKDKRRIALGYAVAIALLAPLFIVLMPNANAATDHCAGHRVEVKVKSDASPATVDVIDTRTGLPLSVVVTIAGKGFSIEPVDPAVVLTDANWCVKSSTKTNSGTGTEGYSTSTNKKGRVQNISYVVIYSVTSEDPAPPPQPCDATTQSGGPGITVTVHELGDAGPLSFLFEWEAFFVPDQFEVLYEGVVVFDTGVVGDAVGEGSGSMAVLLPAGTSTQVTVRVTGPVGTLWEYKVNCPPTT